ncbi:hypothetical protein BC830DRAFT_1086148 [Chytriomyces sp. MP71]|nr:hypothetical protein BC830DRAFT_1086148 [Chytriomyces sp. MP71]
MSRWREPMPSYQTWISVLSPQHRSFPVGFAGSSVDTDLLSPGLAQVAVTIAVKGHVHLELEVAASANVTTNSIGGKFITRRRSGSEVDGGNDLSSGLLGVVDGSELNVDAMVSHLTGVHSDLEWHRDGANLGGSERTRGNVGDKGVACGRRIDLELACLEETSAFNVTRSIHALEGNG